MTANSTFGAGWSISNVENVENVENGYDSRLGRKKMHEISIAGNDIQTRGVVCIQFYEPQHTERATLAVRARASRERLRAVPPGDVNTLESSNLSTCRALESLKRPGTVFLFRSLSLCARLPPFRPHASGCRRRHRRHQCY